MERLTLSPSQINQVRICTARYHYARVAKLPQKKGEAAAYGSSIDSTLECMLNDKIAQKIEPLEYYLTYLGEEFRRLMDETDVDEATRKERYHNAEVLTTLFYKTELPHFSPRVAQFKNRYETDFFNVFQIFDAITTEGVVIDFKCPTKRMSKGRGEWKPKSFDHVLQLYCYYWGYMDHFGEEPTALQLWYFNPEVRKKKSGDILHPAEIVKVPVKFAEIEDHAEDEVRRAWDLIQGVRFEGKYWPNRHRFNFLCSPTYCDFYERCGLDFPREENAA